MQPSLETPSPGMTVGQAKAIEYAIIAISLVSLILLFQPFSLALYSVGAALVVFAGLAFNLVPFCAPGRPLRSLFKVAVIIVVIFLVVTALALGSALLYSWYLSVR
jgi:hypothetical protein